MRIGESKLRNVDISILEEVIKKSRSVSDILEHFSVSKTCPYSRKVLKQRIEEEFIDFEGLLDKSPPKSSSKISDENWFISGMERSTSSSKSRLLNDGMDYCCKICEASNWLGKDLSLHLDHIDGDRKNNKKDNLRLLCPNCHSQTETFAGKKQSKGPSNKLFCECGNVKNYKSKRCRPCFMEECRKKREGVSTSQKTP